MDFSELLYLISDSIQKILDVFNDFIDVLLNYKKRRKALEHNINLHNKKRSKSKWRK